jgi:hypothetical protein
LDVDACHDIRYDAVNQVRHYEDSGPIVKGDIGHSITQGRGQWSYRVKCIDVFRAIKDPRLATALKYIWRVAFGGKTEPWDSRSQRERDTRDIKSAVWYLTDFLDNPVLEGEVSQDASAPTRENGDDGILPG